MLEGFGLYYQVEGPWKTASLQANNSLSGNKHSGNKHGP